MIHHYTNIDTLALILKYRTIRFNRLDRVDDITEGDTFEKLNLAPFFYISCWTDDQKESIPQWNMYTKDMAGVRITFPEKLFNYSEFEVNKKNPLNGPQKVQTPIPPDNFITDSYMIIPSFLESSRFARKVKYTQDYIQRKNNSIDLKIDKNGRFNLSIKDLTSLASYKSPDWRFQNEYRFILFILPSMQIDPNSDEFWTNLVNFISTKLFNGEGPGLNYFDIEINQEVLDNIIITSGPFCDEGDKIIIDSLLAKYTSDGQRLDSNLGNTIRRPNRK